MESDSSWMRETAKPRASKESSAEKTLCEWARQRGYLSWKMTPKSNQAWPDRLFLLPNGRYVWCELKRKNNKPTELQMRRIVTLANRGQLAFWSDNLKDMKRWLLAAEQVPLLGPPTSISKPV